MFLAMLDAGHGGRDPGTSGSGKVEKTEALRATLKIGQYITAMGGICCYTRTGDTYPSIDSRPKFAKAQGANVFASIHFNGSKDSNSNGYETLVKSNTGAQKMIADRINQRMMEIGFRNRGTKLRNKLGVLNGSSDLGIPAVLLEIAFLTNRGDAERYDANFDRICKACAEAIVLPWMHLLEPAKPPQPSKHMLAYDGHFKGLGLTKASVDGEVCGFPNTGNQLEGFHLDFREIKGLRVKCIANVAGKGRVDYGYIDNTTLIGIAANGTYIETFDLIEEGGKVDYYIWVQLCIAGKWTQWTKHTIGIVGASLKIEAIRFRYAKQNEL